MDASTDNSMQPDYTHRIYQRNNNLKVVNKTKNKITKNVNRGNDIRVGNIKQRPQFQDYNNFSQQNPNPHQKTKDFRELKKKSNSILILTDSMLKTLCMGEFNQFLQEGKPYLKTFSRRKSKTT